jgi:hypothetical protein
VTFARHLSVVLVLVAAVAGLGLAWSHSGAAGLVAPPPPGGAASLRQYPARFVRGHPGEVIAGRAGQHPPSGGLRRRRPGRKLPGGQDVVIVRSDGAPPDLTDLGSLGGTVKVMAEFAAAVVVLDLIRRRWRRHRRGIR